METALKEQLWSYIASNNPELMYDLQEEYKVTDYLDNKVAGIMSEVEHLLDDGLPAITVQEICLERLTEDLKPSKFQYIKNVLEQEFPIAYEALQESGMLTYEVINLIGSCERIFERFSFNEHTLDNIRMRYAVMGEIDFYLS